MEFDQLTDLRKSFDMLLAMYILDTKKLPSETSVVDLMTWLTAQIEMEKEVSVFKLTQKDGQFFYEQVEKLGITFWQLGECSFCKYQVGFIFKNGEVYYDSGCNCLPSKPFKRTWQHVADTYNMQRDFNVIKAFNKFWKIGVTNNE